MWWPDNVFDLDRPVKDLKAKRSLGREGDDVLPFYEPWGLIKPLTVDMGESGDEGLAVLCCTRQERPSSSEQL